MPKGPAADHPLGRATTPPPPPPSLWSTPAAIQDCGPPCDPCCPEPPRAFWARGEALLWWIKDQGLPPLVSTTSTQGVAEPSGIYQGRMDGDLRAGFRLTVGGELAVLPLDEGYVLPIGVEGSFFMLGKQSKSFATNLPSDPTGGGTVVTTVTGQQTTVQVNSVQIVPVGIVVLPGNKHGWCHHKDDDHDHGDHDHGDDHGDHDHGDHDHGDHDHGPRLYFLVPTQPNSVVTTSQTTTSQQTVWYPDPSATGQLAIGTSSEMLGADVNGVFGLIEEEAVQAWLLVGGRYLHFNEDLDIGELVTQSADAASGLPQATFLLQDSFRTHNNFFGGQLGLRALLRSGAWSVELQGKTALGSTHQSIFIDGWTVATVGGSTSVGAGGLLTSPANIGEYSRDRFTVVPEGTVNLGYQLTSHFRGFVGYNILYWSSVVRPGPQVVGLAGPTLAGVGSDLWVQGLNLGLEVTY
jgi:hypothetical protein